MSRVALLCPEPLGHGRPAGVGIRFIEFARLLTEAGHDVHVLSPDGGPVENCTSWQTTPETIRDTTRRADVALVQGHIVNDLLSHGEPVPLVADLYDPFIVENLHYWHQRGDEVFTHDHATLLRTVRHADFFLCSSPAQRHFWAGLMIAAGRLNPATYWDDPTLDELLAIVPFGVPPQYDWPASPGGHRVLFGGIYDWYLPELAIEAIELVRERIPDATLHFNAHPNADTTPQRAALRASREVERKGLSDVVFFEPWAAYDDRAAWYSTFSAAISTFPRSLETDLSMRTRILDWIWGGLPIVSSSAAGTDYLLMKYETGLIVDQNDSRKFADALVAVLSDDDLRRTMREGARRFVTDHQWSVLAAPLLEFCRDPELDPTKSRFLPPTPVMHAADRTLFRRILRALRGSV